MSDAWIEPPFHVSYGSHVHVGDGFYANFNLVLVDDADIHIGDRVMIAPNVTISTAGHPTVPEERVGGWQFSLPVRIEDDVWIGANVVILPGVTIGAGSVIGAGPSSRATSRRASSRSGRRAGCCGRWTRSADRLPRSCGSVDEDRAVSRSLPWRA